MNISAFLVKLHNSQKLTTPDNTFGTAGWSNGIPAACVSFACL